MDIMERMKRLLAAAINREAEALLAESEPEVPVEEGTLRGSGHVAKQATPDDLEAVVAYATPYAAAQHEGEIVYTAPVTSTVHEHTRRARSGKVATVRTHQRTVGPGIVKLRHHPKGGKSHYLSDPLKEKAATYDKFLADVVHKGLELSR